MCRDRLDVVAANTSTSDQSNADGAISDGRDWVKHRYQARTTVTVQPARIYKQLALGFDHVVKRIMICREDHNIERGEISR